jgi:hypothetical protein
LLLLLRGSPGLKWLLLRCLLEALALLPWIARKLELLLRRLLDTLRLPRKARELRLELPSPESRRLRSQSSLEAAGLLKGLLLLLAIWRLPGAGAVAAP